MEPTKAWAIIHDQDDGIAYRFFKEREAADWEVSYSPKQYEVKPVLIVDPETHVVVSRDDAWHLLAAGEPNHKCHICNAVRAQLEVKNE